MKVTSRDYSKYSINLKIFKLQSTGNGSSVGEKKSSSMTLPITPIMPTTIQRKRNSWRNAWKMANHNNSQSVKARNQKNTSNAINNLNLKDTNNDDKTPKEAADKHNERLKEQVNNNMDKLPPLDGEDILCKLD